jgi:hypothetical protein
MKQGIPGLHYNIKLLKRHLDLVHIFISDGDCLLSMVQNKLMRALYKRWIGGILQPQNCVAQPLFTILLP